jgi:hypothetical protein
MPTLQVNVVKDEKDEFEIEFFDRMCKNAEEGSMKVLENSGWQKDKKGTTMYKDFKDMEIAEALKAILLKKGIDVYTHEKHHLKPNYTLHISAANAKKEFNKAVEELDKDWSAFKSALLKKIK